MRFPSHPVAKFSSLRTKLFSTENSSLSIALFLSGSCLYDASLLDNRLLLSVLICLLWCRANPFLGQRTTSFNSRSILAPLVAAARRDLPVSFPSFLFAQVPESSKCAFRFPSLKPSFHIDEINISKAGFPPGLRKFDE